MLPEGDANVRDGKFGDEFGFHVQIARNNGLTEDEIAEVIYHSSGYAGFPNVDTAMKVAREVLEGQ